MGKEECYFCGDVRERSCMHHFNGAWDYYCENCIDRYEEYCKIELKIKKNIRSVIKETGYKKNEAYDVLKKCNGDSEKAINYSKIGIGAIYPKLNKTGITALLPDLHK